MIEDHLGRSLARGEAVSALFAAEPAIYGRFGYGLAAHELQLRVPRGAALRDVPGADQVGVRFASADTTMLRCPETLSNAGDTVLYIDNQTLFALDAANDLTPLWSRELERPIAARGVSNQIVVAIRPTDNTTALVLLDAATGDLLATSDLAGARYQPAPGVVRELGDGLVAVLTSNHGDEPGALSVLEVSETGITTRWELAVDEDSIYQQPFVQVARSGEVIAAFTSVDGKASVVGFDLASGEELWRYATSSFDNSAGQIEPIGDRGFAVTPFGGDWIEAVGVDGNALATVGPPAADLSGPLITAFDEGRLAAVGRTAGAGPSV